MKIAVFGAAGDSFDAPVCDEARRFGQMLGERGHALIFGGGRWGVMGAAARGAHEAGARVTGVIPEKLRDTEGVSRAICASAWSAWRISRTASA